MIFEQIEIEDTDPVTETLITESQVVQFMQDFIRANKLDHFSIQIDRPEGTRKGRPSYYCNRRGHSGQSSSLSVAKGNLELEMSRLGEEV